MRQIIAVLLVSLLACPVLARSPYRLPAGTRLQTTQGTFQGYSLEEMKVLLKMDVDLEFYGTEFPKYKQLLEDYRKLIEARDNILKSKDIQIGLLTKDQTRLTEKWSQENKLRHECENKPRFGSWVAWTIVAVTSTIAVTLGIVLIVRETR
jgi:hypothetical protein